MRTVPAIAAMAGEPIAVAMLLSGLFTGTCPVRPRPFQTGTRLVTGPPMAGLPFTTTGTHLIPIAGAGGGNAPGLRPQRLPGELRRMFGISTVYLVNSLKRRA